MKDSRFNKKASDTKPAWSKPEVGELSIEEVVDLAEVRIGFARTTTSCDISPN
jgi:hypothetical protein